MRMIAPPYSRSVNPAGIKEGLVGSRKYFCPAVEDSEPILADYSSQKTLESISDSQLSIVVD